MADRSPLIGHRTSIARGLGRTPTIRGAARFLSRAGGWRAMRESSLQVREATADHLELRRDRWYYYKPIFGLNIAWNAAAVAAATAVMTTSRAERPSLPLRLWIGGHVMQCVVHVILLCVEYRRRGRRRPEAIRGGGDWGLLPPSLPFLLGANEERMGQNEEMISIANSANTIFSFIWWIIGFYWIATTGDVLISDAPQLYWLCVVFLSLDIFFVVFSIALVCVIALAVCFCLPFILGILSYFTNQSEGEPNEHTQYRLTKYKFQSDSGPNRRGGESQRLGGTMIEFVSKGSHKHVLSPEDAECCICKSAYKDGDVLTRLPCSPIIHHFHSICIDKWLIISPICPLCKKSVMTKTTVSEEV